MMFPKPKDQKKMSSRVVKGLRTFRDGREVCETDYRWRMRRWELFVLINDDNGNGGVCFRCGTKLEFGAAPPFASGADHPACNYHAHHSRGTRGLGGCYRDDRIFVPGVFDESLWKEYEFMPTPPEGKVWNLYPLCNRCHHDKEHDQGCHGELQWSGGSRG